MSWKNWPGWLKGGLVGIFMPYVFYILAFAISPNDAASNYFSWILIFLAFWPIALIEILIQKQLSGLPFYFLFSTLFYFLVGAIIGIIIRKLKSKNKFKRKRK